MKTYFVTGSTGAIGSTLVPLLLQNNDAEVRLLIRARDQKHLEVRLADLMTFWGYDQDRKETLHRIKAVRGDVSLPQFGIEPVEYDKLSNECTHIIHSAGIVRMNLPIEEARKSSVDSARNIIALAKDCRHCGHLKKVEFVSTVGVGGRNPGLIPEAWITNKRAFHNTYEEAKAEAEVYIYKQIMEGMPVTVHRPSMVVGDSRTGRIIHFQIFYHLCEFLSGRRTLGITPNVIDTHLDIIPADYVARAIVWSSDQQATIGKILHLCSGPDQAIPISVLKDRVQRLFKSFGEKLPRSIPVPVDLFKAGLPFISLFVSPKAKRAIKTLPVFFDYLAERQAFANASTRAVIEAEGIKLPCVNKYLDTILAYYLRHKKGS
jgi:thioester reductase-like protein